METPEARAFEGYDEFLYQFPDVLQRKTRYKTITGVRSYYLNRQRKRLNCEQDKGENSQDCAGLKRVEGYWLSMLLVPKELLAYTACMPRDKINHLQSDDNNNNQCTTELRAVRRGVDSKLNQFREASQYYDSSRTSEERCEAQRDALVDCKKWYSLSARPYTSTDVRDKCKVFEVQFNLCLKRVSYPSQYASVLDCRMNHKTLQVRNPWEHCEKEALELEKLNAKGAEERQMRVGVELEAWTPEVLVAVDTLLLDEVFHTPLSEAYQNV